ncbi:hypothetical protein CPB84DRAFT_1820011, partial [Gymnopilus junonius]
MASGKLGLISFHILGRRMVVLNSAAVAEDLLNKRSLIYSDRPFSTMAGELMQREKSLLFFDGHWRYLNALIDHI